MLRATSCERDQNYHYLSVCSDQLPESAGGGGGLVGSVTVPVPGDKGDS
jgi:hypothetical protein